MGVPQHFVLRPSIQTIIRIRARQLVRDWFYFNHSDTADIAQSMRLHLIEQWYRYDARRGSPEAFTAMVLDSWERKRVRDLHRLKRRARHRTRPLSRTAASATIDRSWRHGDERLEAEDLLRRCLELIPDDELGFLRLVVALGEQRTADELGITRHAVRQRLALIRAKCKKLDDFDQNPDRP